MAWSTIREATREDTERLEAAATRFIQQHAIERDQFDASGPQTVEFHISWLLRPDADESERDEGRRLKQLWRQVVQRALRSRAAEGIAYGYVGFSVQ